jgi:hypothetical protein
MKRKHQIINYKLEYYIKKHFFILNWVKCEKCELDFRFEGGYSLKIGPIFNGQRQKIYLCKECCQDKEDIILFIHDFNTKNKKLQPPGKE